MLEKMQNVYHTVIRYGAVTLALFFSTSSMAWFFFIPGSLTSAISDAITG